MDNFETYMTTKKQEVESALERLLPSADARPSGLHEAMRYSVFAGGKRLRPILCIACCEAVAGGPEIALTPAAALEILHTYTLIHDDLPCMDDDDLRRGKQSCHARYGETTAVLAGDALHALAFELIGACEAPPPYPPNLLIQELAQAVSSRGLIGGQMTDLMLKDAPTLDDVQYVHATKTAALFRATARIGGISGECDYEQLLSLTEYGLHLGLAFQIADDILDGERDKHADGGVSYLQVSSIDEARSKANDLIEKSISSAKELDKERNEPLIHIAEMVLERAG